MAAPLPPQGWGQSRMSSTVPETLACRATPFSSPGFAMVWPTSTRCPAFTVGTAGAHPAHSSRGMNTRSGGASGPTRGFLRVYRFLDVGWIPHSVIRPIGYLLPVWAARRPPAPGDTAPA